MKNYINYFILLTLCCSCLDNSKKYKVDNFDEENLKWYKPFQKENDTVIYVSDKMEFDTLIYHKPKQDSDSTRGFEQGYSNTNYLTVSYDITLGSYHKFALTGDGKTRCTQNFANMAKSSKDFESLEIVFIGTLFNGENLQKIKKLNDSTYLFRGIDANYTGISVEEGIYDFVFNTRKGVIEYTDYRKVKWKRK
jgi:hypothetical protein